MSSEAMRTELSSVDQSNDKGPRQTKQLSSLAGCQRVVFSLENARHSSTIHMIAANVTDNFETNPGC
jgi:hypothetical protein